MRTFPKICLIVGLVTAALYFGRLGRIPLVESSEGFHVAIAHEMLTRGDWITPHFDSVRYFEKPPLFYWLMAGTFGLVGLSEWTARFWQALAVVGTSVLIAWLGARLGGGRLGLIAGLVFAVNVEVFLFGRLAKPDLLFVFFIVLSFTAFAVAWRDGSRRALLLGWAGLGFAAMAKDALGARHLLGGRSSPASVAGSAAGPPRLHRRARAEHRAGSAPGPRSPAAGGRRPLALLEPPRGRAPLTPPLGPRFGIHSRPPASHNHWRKPCRVRRGS